MMMKRPDRWAYAAGIVGLAANLLLIGFYAFQVGRPEQGDSLGQANDLVGSVGSALMIPVAVAFGAVVPGGRGAKVVQACGISAMVVATLAGPLLVFGVVTFAVQLPIGIAAAFVLFGWVFLVSRSLRAVPGWAPVARAGRVVGTAALIGALIVLGGLLLPWMSTLQRIVLGAGVAIGLVGWLGIPVWLLLVGRRFARAAGRRTSSVAIAIARLASAVHVKLYRRTEGRRGGTLNGVPHLLLTTTGRRTGLPRTRPIGYYRDGDQLIVAASNGGSNSMPAWVFNLRGNPIAEVEIGADRFAVCAAEATGEDYRRRWAQLSGNYPIYLRYPKKTTRHIPVMVLQLIDVAGETARSTVQVLEEEK